MTSLVELPNSQLSSPQSWQPSVARNLKKIDIVYRNNLDSDYTEQIEQLSKSFQYSRDRHHYWSEPEQSLLYGSPLYEQASPAQRLALNHLHWFVNYNYISDSETETVFFNQVTSSVFATLGEYNTLSEELAVETEQEHSHIKAFRKVGLMTATALIGREGLNALLKWNSYKLRLGRDPIPTYEYYALRSVAKRLFQGQRLRYSQFLGELEATNQFIIKAPTTGMLGRSLEHSLPLQSFFSFSWGAGSPFMACQFYAIRIIANLYLKNMEHSIAKYFKKLENRGEAVPTPTAISRYHFLDESFHTTISQLLAKDLYKDFAKPTAHEKFVANWAIYMMQRGTLGGLSGVLPHRYFADDYTIMELVYRVLQSPVFDFSAQDALHWMQRCFCDDHNGFQVAFQNRQRLLSELRRFFDDVDYLWGVNREMRVMSARGSIDQALSSNRRSFQAFSQTLV